MFREEKRLQLRELRQHGCHVVLLCDNVEATVWKRQRGSDKVTETTWKLQGGSDNLKATRWKRQLGSDNVEETT